MIAAFEGRDTWLPPGELYALGFRQVVFPGLLITRIAACLDTALRDLRRHAAGETPMPPLTASRNAEAALREALELDRWNAIT